MAIGCLVHVLTPFLIAIGTLRSKNSLIGSEEVGIERLPELFKSPVLRGNDWPCNGTVG